MATTKSKQANNKNLKLLVALVVGLVVGSVGTYLLKPSNAATFTAGLAFYGSSDASANTPHCQVLPSGTKLCWSNTGDTLWGKAVYKNSVKNPTGKLTCWPVTDSSVQLSAVAANPALQTSIMQGTPAFSQTFSPLAPSDTVFSTQTSGTTAEWCQPLVLDAKGNTVGQGGFGLYAPGTKSIQ